MPLETTIRDKMLMEAIFLFNKYQVSVLPVAREEELVGMMQLNDILRVNARISK